MRILLGGIDPREQGVCEALSHECLVFQTANAEEVVEGVSACSPDVLLLDAAMPEVWEALRRIGALLPAPVVLLTTAGGEMPPEIADLYGCVPRPVDAVTLDITLKIAMRQFQRLRVAYEEREQLREAFAARKLIDRAKGCLMQRRSLAETDAYTFLRNESRRLRVSMAEVAQAVLAEYEKDADPGKRLTRVS